MTTLIHAVKFNAAGSYGIQFCKSLTAAKKLAWKYSHRNPACERTATRFGAEPEIVSLDPTVPVFAVDVTSDWNRGTDNYRRPTVTLREVLDHFGQHTKLLTAERLNTIAANRNRKGVKVRINKRKNTWVRIAYNGTIGEAAAAALREA